VLDEGEKAQLAAAAAKAEVARLRALERERIVKEARERVARDAREQQSKADAEAGQRAAQEAVRKERDKERLLCAWLRRAAALVGHKPEELTICCLKNDSRYGGGTRILINSGGDSRYAREHLVDWNSGSNQIKTSRSLVGKKLELIGFCAELAANPIGVVTGGNNWEENQCAT
jgi:hypothetical protein